mmetsp:Transcript_11276/g.21997  ORF Transcript_11276/g.21997 Transcript_11276/m.21997 type:complete len:91 (-) Transcript_11276:5-277(-)
MDLRAASSSDQRLLDHLLRTVFSLESGGSPHLVSQKQAITKEVCTADAFSVRSSLLFQVAQSSAASMSAPSTWYTSRRDGDVCVRERFRC